MITMNWIRRRRSSTTKVQLLLVLSTLSFGAISTGAILVHTQDEFQEATKDLKPGDEITLANGTWHDFEIVFEGHGTKDQPITLSAETKGEVIISGRSNLRIAGEYLVVKGLVFKDGYTPTNTVVSFRRTKGQLANHSRITEIVIDRFNNPERHETDFWVMMYGKHNRFDHNYLSGKSNKGVTMAVRLDSPESQENYHQIDHNYFGNRPVLGSNGGETLRIGTSHYSLSDSFTRVEHNYFEHCSGEVEIVSSKSGGNTFSGNVFFESQGTLTLRHGNGNTIENNVFFGNGIPHTGGIRVINKRQTVRNNFLYGLRGFRFGGALVIMNGVPNSPINRYHQVEDSVIENNSIIDSSHIELAAGADEERSAPPISTTFSENLIYSSQDPVQITVHDDISGVVFSDNVINTPVHPAIAYGFKPQSPEFSLKSHANGLRYATIELDDIGISRDLNVLQKDETGPDWYPKPNTAVPFDSGEAIPVTPGENVLAIAIEQANPGSVLVLADGDYLAPRTLVIDKTLTIRAENHGGALIRFERNSLFEITDGGHLKLDKLLISGGASPDMAGNSLIRTSRRSMLSNYRLIIEDTVVQDLDTNHSFNVLSIAKHTFADAIEIINSAFANITGSILQLNPELDDLGIYNAEYITIDKSYFKNVGGSVANVYRGGTDESTFGPHFVLKDSILDEVGLGKRNKSQASIRLHGVQDVTIVDNYFSSSAPVHVSETVGDPVNSISNNELIDTPDHIVAPFVRIP